MTTVETGLDEQPQAGALSYAQFLNAFPEAVNYERWKEAPGLALSAAELQARAADMDFAALEEAQRAIQSAEAESNQAFLGGTAIDSQLSA